MKHETEEASFATRGECGHGDKLVAYLYGEATAAEAQDFRRHLDACAGCRTELAAFGTVRESVSLWREESLGITPSAVTKEAGAHAGQVQPARSAWDALREFFALSPAWLRAGGAFAALAVCALLSLTLARAELRWGEGGPALSFGGPARVVTQTIEVPAPGGATREQLADVIAEHERETAQLRSQLEAVRASSSAEQIITAGSKTTAGVSSPRQARKSSNTSRSARATSPPGAPRPLSRRRAEQVAGYEDTAPRLYDLLGEIN